MRHCRILLHVGALGLAAMSTAKSSEGETKPVRVALVKMPYVGERNVPDTSRGAYNLILGAMKSVQQRNAQ